MRGGIFLQVDQLDRFSIICQIMNLTEDKQKTTQKRPKNDEKTIVL